MQIIHDYIYTIGGAEKVLEEFLNIFPESILTTSFINNKSISNIKLPSSVKLNTSLFFTKLAEFRNIIPLLRKLSIIYWLLKNIDAKGEYILVNYTGGFSLFASFRNTPKKILYLHKIPSFAFYLTSNIFKRILTKWFKNSLKNFNHLLTNSEYNKQQMVDRLQINPEKITIVYPVVTTPISGLSEIYPFAKRSYFLYVGRLEPYKGINEIVSYFIRNNLSLKVIGEGSLKDSLPRNSNIEYLGYVNNDMKFETMKKAKALITGGGEREEFGITAVESILSGTPVIAVSAGGVTEIVKNGVTGFLVQNMNDQNISSAINNLSSIKISKFYKESIIMREKVSRLIFREKILTSI